LKKDEDLRIAYEKIINEYLRKGYIRCIPENEMKDVKWWLPHFPIVKKEKETTKVRIVFDAAAKTQGTCLNDLLEAGPKLQNDLLEVLLKFRKYSIALVSDIQEMYLQISISEHDGKYLCFQHICEGKKEYYQFQRLVFGLNVSPFLAQLVTDMNADKYVREFPETVDIKNSTYMDDTTFSVENIVKAEKAKTN